MVRTDVRQRQVRPSRSSPPVKTAMPTAQTTTTSSPSDRLEKLRCRRILTRVLRWPDEHATTRSAAMSAAPAASRRTPTAWVMDISRCGRFPTCYDASVVRVQGSRLSRGFEQSVEIVAGVGLDEDMVADVEQGVLAEWKQFAVAPGEAQPHPVPEAEVGDVRPGGR